MFVSFFILLQTITAEETVFIDLFNDQALSPIEQQESPLISIDVIHMDVHRFALLFTQHLQKNIIIADGVNGTISAQFNNVPADQAFAAIVWSHGWQYVDLGEILIIQNRNE